MERDSEKFGATATFGENKFQGDGQNDRVKNWWTARDYSPGSTIFQSRLATTSVLFLTVSLFDIDQVVGSDSAVATAGTTRLII